MVYAEGTTGLGAVIHGLPPSMPTMTCATVGMDDVGQLVNGQMVLHGQGEAPFFGD